ncbi:MAG: Ig-like domain-containing protein [Clostridia bacterium]|nr:Ig-like domain-containing protein [Clostridia bacterium]
MSTFKRALCLLLALWLTVCASAEIFELPGSIRVLESGAFEGIRFEDGVFLPDSLTKIAPDAFSENVFYGLKGGTAQRYAESRGYTFRAVDVENVRVESPAFVSPYRPFAVKAEADCLVPLSYTAEVFLNGAPVCTSESGESGELYITLYESGLYGVRVTAYNKWARAEAYFEDEFEVYPPIQLIQPGWTVKVGDSFRPVDEAEDRSVSLSCGKDGLKIEGGQVTALALGSYTVTAQAEYEGVTIYTDFTVSVVVPAESLTLDKADAVLYVGETFTPAVTVLPEEAGDCVLAWRSSDPHVAQVTPEGEIRALAQGECTVYATTFDAEAAISVQVKVPCEEIRILPPDSTVLTKGKTLRLHYEALPEYADDFAAEWSSSDESVLTVNPQTGLVTALAPSSAWVTASLCADSSVSDRILITVAEGAEDIEAAVPEIMYAGDQVQIAAQIVPQSASGTQVTFAVSDESILNVSEDGLLTALAPGRARLTLGADPAEKHFDITVYARCEEITGRLSDIYLNPGMSIGLSELVQFAPAGCLTDSAAFASSDPAVAQTDESGRLTAVAAGECTVSVSLDGLSAVFHVHTVTDGKVISSLSVSPTYAVLTPGATAKMVPAMGSPAAKYKKGSWYSADPDVVKVEQTASDGTVTVRALSPGTAKVYVVSSSGLTAYGTVVVNPIAVKKLTLQAPAYALYPGESAVIHVTSEPAGADLSELVMYSSDPSVAAVDDDGTLYAVGAGECEIFASCLGAAASCRVQVNGRMMTDASLTQGSMNGLAGESARIEYFFAPPDASPASFTWTSSDESVARVDARSGVVSFISQGTALISGAASDGSGLYLELPVTVSEIPVRALWLDADELTLSSGDKYALSYTVYPSYASYAEAEFESSDESVARVDENGVVTALRAGSADIFVTAGRGEYAVTRSVSVTVTRTSTAEYRALIMGQFTVSGAEGYLPFSTNGTQGVYDSFSRSVLDGAAYRIKFMPASPSLESFRSAIRQLASQADEDDVTVIYALTHGSYTPAGGYYLAFSGGNAYYADTLINDVTAISGHVVLVLCTCHSGRVFSCQALQNVMAAGGAYTGTNGPGRLSVICSSTDTRSSYYNTANTRESYDFFTKAFTRALGWDMIADSAVSVAADAGGDGKVTLSELYAYCSVQTQNLIARFLQLNGTAHFSGNQNQYPSRFIASGDEDLAILER